MPELYEPKNEERRDQPRYEVSEPARITLLNSGTEYPATLTQICAYGCRLRLIGSPRVTPGARAELSFQLKGIAFRASAILRWVDGGLLGLHFPQMSARRREELAEILADLEDARKAAKARALLLAEPPESQVAEIPMLEAPQEPVSSQVELPTKPAKPKERRKAARFETDARAELFLLDLRIWLPGRIVDLSEDGCRFCASDKLPVGIFRRVEMDFTLDGLPFRVPGVIQTAIDRFTAGIRFVDVSVRKREQLQELIRELIDLDGAGTGVG